MQNMIAQAIRVTTNRSWRSKRAPKLSNYGQGTDWWEANKDHPLEQRNAEKLAEEVLIRHRHRLSPTGTESSPSMRRE